MNLKRKLSSRKFWVALLGFVTSLLVAFNVGEDTIAQVASIITAGATLIGYICVEGYIDGKNKPADIPPEDDITFELIEPPDEEV